MRNIVVKAMVMDCLLQIYKQIAPEFKRFPMDINIEEMSTDDIIAKLYTELRIET